MPEEPLTRLEEALKKYNAGGGTPEQRELFREMAGERGIKLGSADETPAEAPKLPDRWDELVGRYQSGSLDQAQMAQVEDMAIDLEYELPGTEAPPAGTAIVAPTAEQKQAAQITALDEPPQLLANDPNRPAPEPELSYFDQAKQAVGGAYDSAVEAFTGDKRSTEKTNRLPSWFFLPEMGQNPLAGVVGEPELSLAQQAKATKLIGLTATSGPEETARLVKEAYPEIEVTFDGGNPIFKSGVTGKEYAFKPGFQASDMTRAGVAGLEFALGGMAKGLFKKMVGAAGVQGAIETGQAASGGEFDVEQIPMAAAGELIGPAIGVAARGVARGARSGGQAAKRVLGFDAPLDPNMTPAAGLPNPAAEAEQLSLFDQPAGPVDQTPAIQPLPAGDVDVQGILTEGRPDPLKLAQSAKINPEMQAAHQRLGTLDDVAPAMIADDPRFREAAMDVASIGGGETESIHNSAMRVVKDSIATKLDDIGHVRDKSAMHDKVKDALETAKGDLKSQAKALYQEVDQATQRPESALFDVSEGRKDLPGDPFFTPPRRAVLELGEKPSALVWIEDQARQRGGQEGLPSQLKAAAKPLSKPSDGGGVTYKLLDDQRKALINAKMRKAEKSNFRFSGIQDAAADELIRRLEADQLKILRKIDPGEGLAEQFQEANRLTAQWKGIEKNAVDLYAEDMQGTMLDSLTTGMGKLAKGHVEPIENMVAHVPKELRSDVVLLGLEKGLGEMSASGEFSPAAFSKWWAKVGQNSRAKAFLGKHLPRDTMATLEDIALVSKGMARADAGKRRTGIIKGAIDTMNQSGVNGVAKKLLGLAGEGAAVGAVSAVTSPGVMTAWMIKQAFHRSEKKGVQHVQKLFSDPAFLSFARRGDNATARALIKTPAWKRFMTKHGKKSNEIADMGSVRWLTSTYQAGKQAGENESDPNGLE